MQSIQLDGDDFVVMDEEVTREREAVAPIISVIPSQHSPAISGRARIYGDTCPLHGRSVSGEPCSKFSHLPGNGKGVRQPNVAGKFVNFVRALVKPILILAFIFVTGYSAVHLIENVTGNLVPKTAFAVPVDKAPVTPIPTVTVTVKAKAHTK